jgi:hypothetical protein
MAEQYQLNVRDRFINTINNKSLNNQVTIICSDECSEETIIYRAIDKIIQGYLDILPDCNVLMDNRIKKATRIQYGTHTIDDHGCMVKIKRPTNAELFNDTQIKTIEVVYIGKTIYCLMPGHSTIYSLKELLSSNGYPSIGYFTEGTIKKDDHEDFIGFSHGSNILIFTKEDKLSDIYKIAINMSETVKNFGPELAVMKDDISSILSITKK